MSIGRSGQIAASLSANFCTTQLCATITFVAAAVFINYRTGDGEQLAQLVYDRLAGAFGRDEVFLDNHSIRPAGDFNEELRRALRRCSLLLVLIGPQWLDIHHERSQRKATDWTRWEIAEAFALNIPVLPLVRDGSPLLLPEDLPDDIAALARRQYRRWEPRRSDQDLAELVRTVRELVPGLAEPAGPAPKYRLSIGRDAHIYEGPVYYGREPH
jgi:hypothetical protein